MEQQELHHNAQHERDENGVDVSLVRWMLSLTPAERLQVLQSFQDDLAELKALNPARFD